MKESPGSGRRKLSQATETDSGGKDALSPKSLEKDVTKVEAGVSDEEPIEVKCIGEVIKRSNKGKAERKHYGAFEVENTRYALVRPHLCLQFLAKLLRFKLTANSEFQA